MEFPEAISSATATEIEVNSVMEIFSRDPLISNIKVECRREKGIKSKERHHISFLGGWD